MLQLLPNCDIITPDSTEPSKVIKFINSYIERYQCEYMSVDISFLNVLDSCHVSTICSTKHFIKYPNGKIHWKISSGLVSELNKNLNLGNTTYSL